MPRLPRTDSMHRATARSHPASRRKQSRNGPAGRLVLVVGADPAALAVMLDAARRRLSLDQRLTFPVLVTTRRGYFSGREIVLNRREFQDMAASGGFLATWHTTDTLVALPCAVRADLEAGRAVVVPAPSEIISDGRGADLQPWPDIRVVRVSVHTDRAREPLTPHACLGRMLGPRSPVLARLGIPTARADSQVQMGATLASGVSGISAALAGLLNARPAA